MHKRNIEWLSYYQVRGRVFSQKMQEKNTLGKLEEKDLGSNETIAEKSFCFNSESLAVGCLNFCGRDYLTKIASICLLFFYVIIVSSYKIIYTVYRETKILEKAEH